jgi:EAL and modified HD-GYP domain-containing signal transduction protein
MFQFFRRLFGRNDELKAKSEVVQGVHSANADDFVRLNEEVPLQNSDEKQRFVRREAILDRSEKIAGYEFSLLTTLRTRLRRQGGMAARAYDAALLTRLALNDVPSLLGHRLAFVSLSVESLRNPLINQLPSENTVLVLDMGQHDVNYQDVSIRLSDLKQMGFSCGLRVQDAADLACPLLPELNFVQIDVTTFDGLDLQRIVGELRGKEKTEKRSLKLIARDVQSHDDFQFCERCGFDLFQGPFITSRERLRPTTGSINRIAVLPILAMVRKDESFGLIADQLKNEPTLTYKLLRYLNSPALGLQKPVNNLTEALVLIGREKFYRWMSLLLFDFANPTYRDRSLAERALVRGRTLELLAGKGCIPRAGDHLFLVGLFSLLDIALGQPLPELLEKAALPSVVRDTLLGGNGAFSDALGLVILGESDATTLPEQMEQALDRCGIDDATYTPAAAQAIVWANLAMSDGEA